MRKPGSGDVRSRIRAGPARIRLLRRRIRASSHSGGLDGDSVRKEPDPATEEPDPATVLAGSRLLRRRDPAPTRNRAIQHYLVRSGYAGPPWLWASFGRKPASFGQSRLLPSYPGSRDPGFPGSRGSGIPGAVPLEFPYCFMGAAKAGESRRKPATSGQKPA